VTTHCAERRGHGVVVVSGPDATSFLESLVSQELTGVTPGDGVRSLLLTPQGKLDVALRALRIGADEWSLDCDSGYGEQLATSLRRYRIRVDAEIEDHSDDYDLLEVRGHDAMPRVAALAHVDIPDTSNSHVLWGDRRIVRADWPTMQGVDVLGPAGAVRDARDALLGTGVEPFAPGAYEVARIEAGIPRLGVDIDERTIPQEAFLERDAVSFTKGCFLGQELVCRIDTRGHVNRHLRLLRADGDAVPPVGTEVIVDDRPVGTVTSSATVPGVARIVALAMVRREVEPPADARLRWPDGELSVVVEALPGSGS
jgi:folate-binding protein YgfZ